MIRNNKFTMWLSMFPPLLVVPKRFRMIIASCCCFLFVISSHALVVMHHHQNSISFTASPNHQFFVPHHHNRHTNNGNNNRHSNNNRGGGIQMYFDDVSRNAKLTTGLSSSSWMNHLGFGSASDAPHPLLPKQKQIEEEEDSQKKYAKEKMEALHQYLNQKYDKQSASNLSQEEVFSITYNWMCQKKDMESRISNTKSKNNNDIGEKSQKEEEMVLSDSTSLVGCIADFWQSVVREIQLYEDTKSIQNNNKEDYTTMLLYPHCADLYDYGMFSWMKRAIQYSCIIGQQQRQYQIELFHPTFQNQPDIFAGYSPNHSPFPTIALHFSSTTITAKEDDNSLPYIGKWYSSMDTLTRNSIEDLFNSPAATKTTTAATPISSNGKDSKNSYPENINSNDDDHDDDKDGQVNDQGVIKIFQEWAATTTDYHDPTNNKEFNDKHLRIMHPNKNQNMHLYDDHYATTPFFVSRAVIPEKAYADLWSFLTQLIDDKSNGDTTNNSATIKLMSSFLIFTNFTNFNANDFKKFALSVNVALKQMDFDGWTISMEIFHPEYVAKKGSHSHMRRSPYPAIQIICTSTH